MSVCFPGVGLHRSADLARPARAAPAERIVFPGGPYQYYTVVTLVLRSTPCLGAGRPRRVLNIRSHKGGRNLIAGILSTHVRCSLSDCTCPEPNYPEPDHLEPNPALSLTLCLTLCLTLLLPLRLTLHVPDTTLSILSLP